MDSPSRSQSPSLTEHAIPITFLRTPTTPTDPYTTLFSPSISPPYPFHFPSPTAPGNNKKPPKFTYEPHHIPTLAHIHQLEPLLDVLSSPTFPYSALIFTSQRAVSAFEQACSTLSNLTQSLSSLAIPLYVVGPATAHSLRQIQKRHLPRCGVWGEEAGTGEALAEIILRQYHHHDEDKLASASAERGGGEDKTRSIRMGFLTGEKHRDVIPRKLQMAGIQVEEIVVYSTEAKKDFLRDLNGRLKDVDKRNSGHHWVVFFSAFAAAEILSCIGALSEEQGKVRDGWYDNERRKTRVAAIGPTTAEALERNYGLVVDALAEKPSPEGVRDAVEEAMSGMEMK